MSELEKAIGLWRAGKFVEAGTLCAALLAEDFRNVAVLNLLAEVHKATGNGSGAIECLARVSALCPQDAPALRRLADAYFGAGELASAIQRYREALELEPNNARAHNNLGLAQARSGDRLGAEASYRRALTLDPRYPVAHNNLGNLLVASGDSLRALACYERAVALAPGFLEAWSSSARELLRLERFGEAITCCERSLALKPDDAATAVMLVSALRRVGRLEVALQSAGRRLRAGLTMSKRFISSRISCRKPVTHRARRRLTGEFCSLIRATCRRAWVWS